MLQCAAHMPFQWVAALSPELAGLHPAQRLRTVCMAGPCAPILCCALQVDLTQSTSCTLPFESLRQLRTICVSPDGTLLLAVDVDGRSLLINRRRRTLLHHFTFKHPVAAAKFSPDGKFIACAVGRLLQVGG